MRKFYRVKWTSTDTEKVEKLAARFNAKLTRIAKTRPEISEYQPYPIDSELLIERLQQGTRADLDRTVSYYSAYLKEGAEKPITTEQGVKTTKYEIDLLSKQVARINRKRAQEVTQADVSEYKGNISSLENRNLRPKQFNPDRITQREWNKYFESVQTQATDAYEINKMQAYKSNYLKAIDNVLGPLGNELRTLIEGLPPNVVYWNYYADPLLQLDFIYDPLQAQVIASAVLEKWREVIAAYNE